MKIIPRNISESFKIVKDQNDFDVKLSNSYSGRFMYGDTCLSISGDCVDVEKFITNVVFLCGSAEEDEILQIMESKRLDDFGRGVVVYFPGWKLPETLVDD